MPQTPKVFTLEEANAVLPRLTFVVGEQMLRRAEIETLLRDLGEMVGSKVEVLELDPADPAPLADLKRTLIERVREYERGWGAVEELGAVLKDERVGLVDFYGQVDGQFVWLCWKYGEPSITHYHALGEGFSGRKPIHEAMRVRHLN